MNRVPYCTIRAAKNYEPDAVAYVFHHFSGYVAALTYIDDDLMYCADIGLYRAIECFQFREPPEDFA